MRKTTAGLMSLALASGLGAALTAPSAAAPPETGAPVTEPEAAHVEHVLPNPLAEKQNELREEAITQVLNGEATPEVINGQEVVKVAEDVAAPADAEAGKADRKAAGSDGGTVDQYVPLSLERTDRVFVLLVEFGNERDPRFPDVDIAPTIPGPARFDGPLFNEIPEPDRTVDNSTGWNPNYDRAYYEDLYFGDGSVTGTESMREYYERQSSGRYSVEGYVSDIVTVPFNEARYGRSDDNPNDANGNDPNVCSSNVCNTTWDLVRDGMNAWVDQQIAAGQTPEQVAETIKSFDVFDRYDFDGDGDFNESDGYVDKLQIIHSGGDQADGDPYQGEDAIWSHRWRTYQQGQEGPGPESFPIGGSEVGDTGVWAADYTIQPENGGLSVVAHEYGHDLGLPDHYDTAASGDNPVSWWTLMAQSRVSAPQDNAIGSRAADLSAWDKLQLGWLDYEVVGQQERLNIDLGPHEYNSDKAQAVVIPLPDKIVAEELVAPVEGVASWWSGADDDYTATMSRQLELPAGTTATLAFQTWFNIEEGYDYAYVEVDAGNGWTTLPGTGTSPDPALDNGIDGDTDGQWVPATFDLSAYAGQTVQFRVRYTTDGGVQGNDPTLGPAGIFVDDISVTVDGTEVFADGAEASPNGWALDGFASVGATRDIAYDRYYIASNRQYVSFDQYLQTGPYNFGFPDRPDLVEHFPYQNGLLVSIWDTQYSDNNTSVHPGEGEILPFDAHPRSIIRLDGQPWRGRIQTYDAPFGLEKADSFTLHAQQTGEPSYIRGQKGVPTFDDSDVDRYFEPDRTPGKRVGVKTAGAGVKITVLREEGTSMRIRVDTLGMTY